MSHAEDGFSLLEMMVAVAMTSLALALAGTFFANSRNAVLDELTRQETLQGLRASLDTLERDLRLGGACLPTTGNDYPPLSSDNAGTMDGLTTRTGLVRSDMTCIKNTICTCVQNGACQASPPCPTSGIEANATTLPLQSVDGFVAGQRAYIRGSNDSGEYFDITDVDPSRNTLTIDAGLHRQYPNGSGVYAVLERVYSIDQRTYAPLTVLTFSDNGADPVPFAYGVQTATIQYELNSDCPPCDVVDLPSATEWPLVNELYVTVTMRSPNLLSNGHYYTVSGTIDAKPRNLLPGSQVLGPMSN
jgi:prepilin-type N-terminal cleavage/methylation domain-containing protein